MTRPLDPLPRVRGQTEFVTPLDIDAALRQLQRICDARKRDYGKAQVLVRRFQNGVPALEAIVFVTRLMMGGEGRMGPMSLDDAVTALEAELEDVGKERDQLRKRVAELGKTEKKLTSAVKALRRVQGTEVPPGRFHCADCGRDFVNAGGLNLHRTKKHSENDAA